MASTYDHSFSPYVIPGGIPLEPHSLPDLRWLGLMLRGQLRGALGEQLIRLQETLPAPLAGGLLGRGLEKALERLVPEAPGYLSGEGDAEFAYQRFAGINSLTIRRVESLEALPSALRLDSTTLQKLVPGCPSLQTLLDEGRLLEQTYDALNMPDTSALQPGKYAAPVHILFCLAPELDAPFPVVPLAIACPAGAPGGETIRVTPLDGRRWQHARWLATSADINYSELVLHLGRAHFMTVPFALAMRRRLSTAHPLKGFLLPHLRFNLFVDRMAWLQGVRHTDGILNRSLAGEARWSHRVALSLHHTLSFREQHFERDLRARGVDGLAVDYPYRDDGQLLWNAIHRLVQGFVELTWKDEAALANDSELHAFLAEVQDPACGNVRGLLADGHLATREELVDVLTQVIFVAGPLHGLFHYGSAAQLQYAEENPSFLTGNPLTDPRATKPGRLKAMHQFTRVVSTNVRYDRLGDFSQYPISKHMEYQGILASFGNALADIEATIALRNRSRLAPFVHFLPSRITNGITV